MKKLIFSAIALFVLTASSASAISIQGTQIQGQSKPKSGTTTNPPATGPSTDSMPPTCPYNDPNGCHILD